MNNNATQPLTATLAKGVVATCNLGLLGLITEDRPIDLTYPDGNEAQAWIGIQLNEQNGDFGGAWSSRQPRALCRIEDVPAIVGRLETLRAHFAGLDDPRAASIVAYLEGRADSLL